MRKENNKLNQVIKNEIKEFENWKLSNSLFIINNKILTDFVNLEKNVETDFVEFLIFNKMVLNDKYSEELNDFKINTNSQDLLVNVEEVFKLIYGDDEYEDKFKLIKLIDEYSKITKNNDWNMEVEYDFVKKYWTIQNDFYEKALKNYNKYLLFLNKLFFEKQKGIKKYEQ